MFWEVWWKVGEVCREYGVRMGMVAGSMGEGWDGLKGACRKIGDGCREYGGRLEGSKEVWRKVGEGCREY